MSGSVTQPFDDRARLLCPGLRVDSVLHRTGKAVLLAGVLDGVDVVAKLLTDAGPFWQARFTAEIDTHAAFEVAPPPVPAPRLLAADPDAGVLVTTRLPGVPVARDRYPATLHPDAVRVMLQTARDLQQWSASGNVFTATWDYPHRFHRYRTDYGLLDARDEAALNALAAAAGPMRPAHGDLLPANVLRAPAGMPAGVVDWEFTGRYLPGLDAALLWLVLGRLPAARQEIERFAGDSEPDRAGFWTNVAALCIREVRTHGDLPHGPLRAARLAYLAATWRTVRARVHKLAGLL
ncbi:phosphotransferase [Actinoplanes sp. URMC 104]|uniref:phosphotransferase n=1 Tax=Actinoplanes sp. URMC 104 TaxID=3423409 RepID=UPI003F1DD97A